MISRLSSSQSEFPDDLVVADSPSLRRRPTDTEFVERPLFVDKPSRTRRATRAFLRFLFAVGLGVAATLAWQSYGGAAKQMAAGWAAQYGWSLPWLSDSAADEPNAPASSATQAVARAAPETAAPAGPAPEQRQLDAITGTLSAMMHRIDQLAAGQVQMVSDIAKLQAAEQEMRQQIAAAAQRPAAPPASKSAPPPARSSTLPR
jgi:hypothetical protein